MFALVLALGHTDGSGQYEHGEIARNMIDGHGFSMHWPYEPNDPERAAVKQEAPRHASAFLPPLNPAIVATAIAIFGDSAFAAFLTLLFYALASALQSVVAYAIARHLTNESGARLAAVLAALFLPAAYASTSFSGSPLYQLLAMLVMLMLIRALHNKRIGSFIATGFVIALLVHLRAEFLAFGVILMAAAAWFGGGTWKAKVLRVGAGTVVLLACITPWLLRNHSEFGQFVGMSSHPWNEIWRGTNAQATGSSFWHDGTPVWVGVGPWEHIADRMDSLPYNHRFELVG